MFNIILIIKTTNFYQEKNFLLIEEIKQIDRQMEEQTDRSKHFKKVQ